MRIKGDGFLLFLKAFSWETESLSKTIGDFTVKNPQNWDGKSVFNWKLIK